MILGFDIGNTSTSLGIYRREGLVPSRLFRYNTDRTADPSSLAGTVRSLIAAHAGRVDGFVVSTVVNEVRGAYREAARGEFGLEALEIGPDITLNVTLDYEHPGMLGPDRIVNAAAAARLYGGNCIVVDMGTATTMSVVLEGNTFAGGAIAPGIGPAMKALASNASLLMEVPLEAPPSVVGRNTADCIKSGFFHGWASMVEGFVRKTEAHYRLGFTVIITGGFSRLFSGRLGIGCVIDPLLTMKGIKLLYDMNRRAAG